MENQNSTVNESWINNIKNIQRELCLLICGAKVTNVFDGKVEGKQLFINLSILSQHIIYLACQKVIEILMVCSLIIYWHEQYI